MNKKKIAISIDTSILNLVDSYIDNSTIRSRSQAIEFLIKKSLKERPVNEAVLLIHPDRVDTLLKKFMNSTLLETHVEFLIKNNIKKLFIVTRVNNELKNIVANFNKIKIILINQEEAKGTANAIQLLKNDINGNFIVLNGDTYNHFDLNGMVKKHLDSDKLVTIGLISSTEPQKFGSVSLSGDLIVEFKEKVESQSNIINAGIYVFNKNIFNYLKGNMKSLEKELFPILAKKKELQGFFTHGNYYHSG